MKKRLFGLLFGVAVLTTGCFSYRVEEPEDNDPPFINQGIDGPYDPIARLDGESGEGYRLYSGQEVPFTKRELDQSTGADSLPSVGTSKLLVVPVNIKGASKSWDESMLNKINSAFFGKAVQTSWQSVSSFYETASYGKLKIVGEVAPVFSSQISISSLIGNVVDGEKRPDLKIVNEWIKDVRYKSLRQKYDLDGNDALDGVAFIYNVPVNSKNGFWAWTTWIEENHNFAPSVRNYLWASYFFLNDAEHANYGNNGIDCHVLIHEVGHLLGLDDYYPYEKDQLDVSGGLEMHSYNIGDENIYSKYVMGWADPYYVNTSTSITLNIRPSALYGDAIIINDFWNNTPYDEYVILEYYTPQLNNYLDSIQTYKSGFKMFTESGIRMYHVDSRVVHVEEENFVFEMPSKIDLRTSEYLIGPCNSPSRAYLNDDVKDKYKLLHLIDGDNREFYNAKNRTERNNAVADNDSLFKTGDVFEANQKFFKNNGNFNSGNEVGYSIRINSLSAEYANVTITKI